MESRLEAVIEGWQLRSCDPGYAGLHELEADEFSGAVLADGARGIMVNGRLIGILDGTIESFWGAELRVMEAEDPATPLWGAMVAKDAEVQAEYYTGETTISEVDGTLSSSKFTGYLELSENVFSGDYYVLYYGGTSLSVAFVGTDDQVITGEEAFQRANEEVGIYEVKSVDIEVIDIPDAEVDDSARQALESDESEDDSLEPAPEANAQADQESTPAPEQTEDPETDEPSTSDEGLSMAKATDEEQQLSHLAEAARAADGDAVASLASAGDAKQADWSSREVEVIPSLDPGRSTTPPVAQRDDTSSSGMSTPRPRPTSTDDTESEPGGNPQPTGSHSPPPQEAEQEITTLETERDELAAENERLESTIEELETEIERLETELEELRQSTEAGDMAPATAISGTNLFIGYQSKAHPTLNDAIHGGASATDLQENLQLDWHTEFDASDVRIGEKLFDEFLPETLQHRFAEWLVGALVFELRDTGAEGEMPDLYRVLPEMDRIEFEGEVPVHTEEDGKRESQVYPFDIVVRNSMGDPLLLFDVNDDRDPVAQEAVNRIIESAHTVATARDSVAAAGYVTSSYYEPAGLESATDATSSGLLRGGSKRGFVNVSRKRGFHLCLIEARGDSFHVTVPEL